jgi:hypothetical protein
MIASGALVRWAGASLLLMLVIGCTCAREKKPPSEDLSKPPAPLVAQTVPADLKVEVYPQVGATSERPVVIVVAQDQSYCRSVREQYRSVGHVLCVDQPLEVAEPKLKQAAAYLKTTYPRHVASAPVHLVTDPARREVGWRLMLKEPGFFAHAFLPGLEEKALTNVTLSALHSRGARTLVLTLERSKRIDFLAEIAARRGLKLHPLGASEVTLPRAVSLLQAADERLAPVTSASELGAVPPPETTEQHQPRSP